MIKYNINTINNNINKYINSVVRVCYNKKEENEMPDDTGVVLLAITDEGFDTSAGIFKDIWVWDEPVPLIEWEGDDPIILWRTIIDSRCVSLLPVSWFAFLCVFTDVINDKDPVLNDDTTISFLDDIDIEGSLIGASKVFSTTDNIKYTYTILL